MTSAAVSERPPQLELQDITEQAAAPAARAGDWVERITQLLGLGAGAAAGPAIFLPHLYPHLREGSWVLLMLLPGVTVGAVFGLGWAAGRATEKLLFARRLAAAGLRPQSLPAARARALPARHRP